MSEEAAFVQITYDELARLGQSDLCCSPAEIYREDELAALPEEVLRLSSGCGHPVDGAAISEGETVVDIGSGAGADCFLAARRTGPGGRVVGVDPSPRMRALAERHRDEADLPWVSFAAGDAAALPLPDGSADVVISNCVLTLASDAGAAWREIARVLRPGGRFVVSDVIGGDPDAPVASGSVAKARCETGLSWPEYRAVLRECGLRSLRILRVGPAAFRDGFRARSVTVAGNRSPGGVASIVLHDPAHAASAGALAGEVESACGRLGLRYDGHVQSRDSTWGRQLLELFEGDGDLVLVLDAAVALTARSAALTGLGPDIERAVREAGGA
ncbi:methyltransferase domain-containing protein [Actinomadura sp. 9N407]|uniref:methyltransferase domain-containing protein n=1 Tax=Actinomadura sp. 9N407 TaxID=3375154 RepID=UPI0037BCE58E